MVVAIFPAVTLILPVIAVSVDTVIVDPTAIVFPVIVENVNTFVDIIFVFKLDAVILEPNSVDAVKLDAVALVTNKVDTMKLDAVALPPNSDDAVKLDADIL